MAIGTVFVNNGIQAIRLPQDMPLLDGVHKVEIRAQGSPTHHRPHRTDLGQLLSGRSPVE